MWKILFGAVIGALIAITIGQAVAADLNRYEQVKFWDKDELVMNLLGRPDSEVLQDTFGVQRRRWKWTTGGRSYVLLFVFDRVVGKKVCTGHMPDC